MNTYELGLSQGEFEDLKKELAPKEMETDEIFVSVTSESAKEKPVDSVDQPRDVHLDIHHIDVNQGESTLIAMRYEGRCILSILIDGGLQRDGGGMLIRLLNQLGIESLDAVVVSHFDQDHYEGLTRLLNNYSTFYRRKKPSTSGDEVAFEEKLLDKELFLKEDITQSDDYIHLSSFEDENEHQWRPIGVFNVFIRDPIEGVAKAKGVTRPEPPKEGAKKGRKKKLAALFKFEDAVKRSGAALHYIDEGDELVLDCDADLAAGSKQFKLRCLCVNRGSSAKTDDDENAHSIGWLLRFGKYTYYTAGDLPTADRGNPVEDVVATALAEELKEPITAIKCGHHGSKSSTSKVFLDKLKPPLVFISSGKQDGYRHPHTDVLVRLWEEPSVRALFLTNCAYNRPLLNENYGPVTYGEVLGFAHEALKALRKMHGAIDLQEGDEAARPSQRNCPAAILAMKRQLHDDIITPLSTALGILGTVSDSTAEDAQVLALKAPLETFERWIKDSDSSYARKMLQEGLKVRNESEDEVLRQADLHDEKVLDTARQPWRLAVTLGKEFCKARAALKTEREQPLFRRVVGTETLLGNTVFRMNLLDAHQDARVAFVGFASKETWCWLPCAFGAIDLQAVPPPKDDYYALMVSETQKTLKPPDSPGKFSGYIENRTENQKRSNPFVSRLDAPTGNLLELHPRKKQRRETPPTPPLNT